MELKIDKEQFTQNQIFLADTIRMALYENNQSLFTLLEYENDVHFLEPSCFCYFLSDISFENKPSLEQILFGYISEEKRPLFLNVKADLFGLVNLPNLGYIRANPYEVLELSIQQVQQRLVSSQFVEKSSIRLCFHPTNLLASQGSIKFDESVEQSLCNHHKQLTLATSFYQKHLSCFWQLIESCTREFVIFSSPNYNSFAGIQNHGTAYFNVENTRKSVVFFIDDIAHQCGHIIFNVLTLNFETYLKVPKDSPLSTHTSNPQELRGVYGAFHGLFTYTTILVSLNVFLEKSTDSIFLHEAIGRIGFYLEKFEFDLKLMNNSLILTQKGLEFRKQLEDVYLQIHSRWYSEISNFDYSNQPYVFQYNLFNELNPVV